MRPTGSAEELEARRRLAVSLLHEGRCVLEVAQLVGASASSVRRWRSAAQDNGVESLQAKRHPGPRRRLTRQQERELTASLLSTVGLRAGNWSCSDVSELIADRFGVAYHADHVWRLLRRLGWSYGEGRGWTYKDPEGNLPSSD